MRGVQILEHRTFLGSLKALTKGGFRAGLLPASKEGTQLPIFKAMISQNIIIALTRRKIDRLVRYV